MLGQVTIARPSYTETTNSYSTPVSFYYRVFPSSVRTTHERSVRAEVLHSTAYNVGTFFE